MRIVNEEYCEESISACRSDKSVYSAQPYQLEISELSSLEIIGIKNIQKQKVAEKDDAILYKIPQIATVFTNNDDSEILALFYDESIMNNSAYDSKIYPALYLLKPEPGNINAYPQTYTHKMIEPEKSSQIIGADFNDK